MMTALRMFIAEEQEIWIMSNRFRGVMSAFLMLVAAAVLVLPGVALAQDEPPVEDVGILVGVVETAPDGTIMVEGYVIDTSMVTLPSPLNDGDIVIVIGIFTDDMTLQATSFELFEEQPDEDMDDDMDGDMEDDMDDDSEYACNDMTNPVAMRIAEAFEVTNDEVAAMHCDGNGFGNIVRAYLLAEASAEGDEPMTAEEYLMLHHSGMGWGNIVRESGVHPSDLAPGQIRNQDDMDDTVEGDDTAMRGTTTSSTGPGNSNNHGNSNGNNGNGNSNNGNGNGNNGNNGNSNGNGRGNGKGN